MSKSSKAFAKNLGLWIIISMFVGIIVGLIMGPNATMFKPLGEIFMQLIKMVVIPLVASSIIMGAASIGNSKSAGKIGAATFGYYLTTTAFAVVLGLIFGQLFKPGIGVPIEEVTALFSTEYADKGSIPGFFETIKGIIPTNPIESLVSGNMLQILFFCLFLGFGISTLEGDKKTAVTNFFGGLTDALIFVIMKVMYIAPIGVFALMADSVGTLGTKLLVLVLKLFGVYVIALLIQTFGVYGAAIKFLSKVKPLDFFKKLYPVQLVALSTSSSMATLPFNMETCENELDVSKETTSFVLPLGATINMDGNAVYYALAACFFAQFFNIPLGPTEYIAIIFTATVGSIGQAGVPGPSLLVVAVLIAANIPIVALPLLFGVDRIFDMLRTAVNVTGDASCAVIVDRFKE
ncbi:dicarboxylate/amino acid:cation symporter [Clostridium sp. DL1XJH146]